MTKAQKLQDRTKQFAVDSIRLVRTFPQTLDGDIVGRQLVKAATGVAANYRASCRARSAAEFVARIGTVCEESDESQFWLELTVTVPVATTEQANTLLAEATELTRIFTASRNTAKANLRHQRT